VGKSGPHNEDASDSLLFNSLKGYLYSSLNQKPDSKICKGVFIGKKYGLIKSIMTVLSMDMVAQIYGQRTIKEYFEEIRKESNG
jgi:hypothetical protein